MKFEELIKKVENNFPVEGIPHIGSLFQFYMNRKFNKRIKQNEEKLKKILLNIPIEEFEFFGENIGTLVIEKVLRDEQDDKCEFLILGYENCVNNRLKEEDKIINFFDVISELRMMDIKRLIYIFEFLEELNPENIFGPDDRTHLRYVDAKLERMGLIKKPIIEANDTDTIIDEVAITNFGFDTLNFIGYSPK